jgi:hypothetical protein
MPFFNLQIASLLNALILEQNSFSIWLVFVCLDINYIWFNIEDVLVKYVFEISYPGRTESIP